MATHSGILAWRTAWAGESGGLQSTQSQRAGHDWATNTHTDIIVFNPPKNSPVYPNQHFANVELLLRKGLGPTKKIHN